MADQCRQRCAHGVELAHPAFDVGQPMLGEGAHLAGIREYIALAEAEPFFQFFPRREGDAGLCR